MIYAVNQSKINWILAQIQDFVRYQKHRLFLNIFNYRVFKRKFLFESPTMRVEQICGKYAETAILYIKIYIYITTLKKYNFFQDTLYYKFVRKINIKNTRTLEEVIFSLAHLLNFTHISSVCIIKLSQFLLVGDEPRPLVYYYQYIAQYCNKSSSFIEYHSIFYLIIAKYSLCILSITFKSLRLKKGVTSFA